MDNRLMRVSNKFGKTAYEYRLNGRRRVRMFQVDPKTVMVSFKNAGDESEGKQTYLVRYEDRPRDTGSLFKWAALKAKTLHDSQRKFERFWTDMRIKRIGRGVSRTRYFFDELKGIFERENIGYCEEEMPKLRKLMLELDAFPDPEQIKQRAIEKDMSLSDSDVTKVYWGIHALQSILSEVLKRDDRKALAKDR